jgi:hypothetical protein
MIMHMLVPVLDLNAINKPLAHVAPADIVAKELQGPAGIHQMVRLLHVPVAIVLDPGSALHVALK